ncbi:MAG TPA: hypothetical protein VM686_42405 [Polyangiaceae bacterium]|nr:hypothetical protein [Polyangiaceae bacterium]
MSTSGSSVLTRVVVIGVCLGGTLLGLRNTYGDNSEAEVKAKAAACGEGRECQDFRLLNQGRSAFSQTFSYQVSLTEKGRQRSASTDVECKRAYILLGDFECKVTSGGLPAPAGS